MAIEFSNRHEQEADLRRERIVSQIAYLKPDLPTADQILPFLREVDQNGWYTNFGPLSQRLRLGLWNAFFSDLVAEEQLVLCSSGTAAIELGLQEMGLEPGARVLLPHLTFPATALAVIRQGLVPVLADVDQDTWLLTPNIVREVRRTVLIDAVLPVAAYGMPQDIDAWAQFRDETGVPVLIDAAPALGSQPAGYGIPVAFSMHATKAFGIGEGGLLVASSIESGRNADLRTNFGFDAARIVSLGTNAKLSEYHAAVGLAQLDRWDDLCVTRDVLKGVYRNLLSVLEGMGAIGLQCFYETGPSSIVLRVDNGVEVARLQRYLARAGIETRRLYWPSLSEQPAIAEIAIDRTTENPLSGKNLAEKLLALPFHTRMESDQCAHVVAMLARALGVRPPAMGRELKLEGITLPM